MSKGGNISLKHVELTKENFESYKKFKIGDESKLDAYQNAHSKTFT